MIQTPVPKNSARRSTRVSRTTAFSSSNPNPSSSSKTTTTTTTTNPATGVIRRNLHHRFKNQSTLLPAPQKWAQVLRPPQPGVGFQTLKWVPVDDLTAEEREKYDETMQKREEAKRRMEEASAAALKERTCKTQLGAATPAPTECKEGTNSVMNDGCPTNGEENEVDERDSLSAKKRNGLEDESKTESHGLGSEKEGGVEQMVPSGSLKVEGGRNDTDDARPTKRARFGDTVGNIHLKDNEGIQIRSRNSCKIKPGEYVGIEGDGKSQEVSSVVCDVGKLQSSSDSTKLLEQKIVKLNPDSINPFTIDGDYNESSSQGTKTRESHIGDTTQDISTKSETKINSSADVISAPDTTTVIENTVAKSTSTEINSEEKEEKELSTD